MTKAHTYTLFAVIALLGILAIIVGCAASEDIQNDRRAQSVSQRSKMQCEYLGKIEDKDADSYRWYARVYFCKHEERNACFYVVADYDALTMASAPCLKEVQ